MILNGGDALLRMLLFWSMFLPLDCLWSVDRRTAKKRPAELFRSTATAGVMFQVCLMYWMTGYFKFEGAWRGHEALASSLQFDSYALPLAYLLRESPGLISLAGKLVLTLELVGPMILLVPFRRWPWRCLIVGLFALLHLAIQLTLTVGLFSWVCWTALLLFIPSGFWDSISRSGWSWLERPKTSKTGDAPTASGVRRRVATDLLLVTVTVYVAWTNLSGTRFVDRRFHPPAAARRFGDLLFLHQKWRLFDSTPSHDGWYVPMARLQDGRTVDLLRDGAEADWDSFTKPKYTYRRFPDHRWRKLYRRLLAEKWIQFREPLCRYLAAKWNQQHGGDERAIRIELEFIEEMSDDPRSDRYVQRSLHAIDVPITQEPARQPPQP